jgi:hypothetical protein
MMDFLGSVAATILLCLMVVGIVVGLTTAPIPTIVLMIIFSLSPFIFNGCAALDDRRVHENNLRVEENNSRVEAQNDLLARNLKHANKELTIYADSLGLRPGVCASTPRYGVMVPCVVGLSDRSGTVGRVFCPWSPDHHGCILSLDPKNEPPGLLNRLEVNTMSMAENKGLSETFNNSFERSNINNFSNKVSDNARQQGNQNIYTNEQKQDLAESAAEIQRLLKQLEESNPTATESEKVSYVNDETTPSLKRRVVKALIAGGESAIEEFLDNSYAKIIHSVIKGWMESN